MDLSPHILCIEDDPALQALLMEILRQDHMTAEGVASVSAALQALGQRRFDAVLVDYYLPDRDGMAVIYSLAESSDSPPAVMLSTSTRLDVAVEAMKLGLADYLEKDSQGRFLSLVAPTLRRAIHQRQLQRQTQRMQQALQESEQRFRAFTENSQEIIAVVGTDRQLKYLSPSTHALLQQLPEEWVGREMTELLHAEDYAVFTAILQRVLQEGDNGHEGSELRWQHGNGEWRTLAVLANDLTAVEAVAGIVLHARDITDRHVAEQRISYLAYHDPLTGLANRRHFLERSQEALAKLREHRGDLAILFVDLDRFKPVNDTFGHAAGDELLKQVARRLQAEVRQADTVARLGGDEFAVLLETLQRPEDARTVADKILSSFNRSFTVTGQQICLTTSIGISVSAGQCVDMDTLIKQADTAMYQVKAEERNGYRFFDPAMINDSDLLLSQSLHQALEQQRLLLHYQPRFRLADRQVTANEALLRLQHSNGKLLMPGNFLPDIKDVRLASSLDSWVLNHACQAASGWLRPLSVAVNLGRAQFLRPDLVAVVSHTLERHELPAARLELEIAENLLSQEQTRSRDQLHALQALGIRTIIDDGGLGALPLNLIQDGLVDALKLDTQVIRRLDDDPRTLAMVQGLLLLAQELGLEVIAEGIETITQLQRLQELGCTEGAGRLLSLPLARDLLDDYLRQNSAIHH